MSSLKACVECPERRHARQAGQTNWQICKLYKPCFLTKTFFFLTFYFFKKKGGVLECSIFFSFKQLICFRVKSSLTIFILCLIKRYNFVWKQTLPRTSMERWIAKQCCTTTEKYHYSEQYLSLQINLQINQSCSAKSTPQKVTAWKITFIITMTHWHTCARIERVSQLLLFLKGCTQRVKGRFAAENLEVRCYPFWAKEELGPLTLRRKESTKAIVH